MGSTDYRSQMPDMPRIKNNVAKMASMGAPEADIDGYIASEGLTVDDVRAFKMPPAGYQKQELPQRKVSKLESGIRGYGQGATANLSDEIVAGMGASVATLARPELFKDQSFGDTYREGRQMERDANKAAYEQNPWTYGLSEVGGGALTIPVGKTIQPFNTATRAGRVLNAGGAGMQVGAAYGLGSSEADVTKGDIKGAYEDTAMGGLKGGLLGAAMQYGGEKVGEKGQKLWNRFVKGEKVPTASDVKAYSTAKYEESAAKGGLIYPKWTDDFLDNSQKEFKDYELGLVGKEAQATLQNIDDTIRGKHLTINNVNEIDKSLTAKINEMWKTKGPTEDAFVLQRIQQNFRDMVDEIPDTAVAGGKDGVSAWKEAKKLWSASKRMEEVDDIIERASYMQNPATGIKTGFRNLKMNKKRLRGYSFKERKLIEKAAKTGKITGLLELTGSRLLPLMMTAKGGPLAGAAAYGVSGAARAGASAMQTGRAKAVSDEIARNVMGIEEQPHSGKTMVDLLSKMQGQDVSLPNALRR